MAKSRSRGSIMAMLALAAFVIVAYAALYFFVAGVAGYSSSHNEQTAPRNAQAIASFTVDDQRAPDVRFSRDDEHDLDDDDDRDDDRDDDHDDKHDDDRDNDRDDDHDD